MSTTISRADDIAARLYGLIVPVKDQDGLNKDTQEALNEGRKSATSMRLVTLATVAELSHAEAWTPEEIGVATKRLASMGNNKSDKSLATFASEIGTAAHPRVRQHVPALFDAVSQAWDLEDLEAKQGGDTPIKRALIRKYHGCVRALTAAKDGVLLDTIAKVMKFANENDPQHDPKRAHKRLHGIIADLRDIGVAFPDGELSRAAGILDALSVEALQAARGAKLDAIAAAKPQPVPVAASPVDEVLGDVEDVDLEDGAEPMAGAAEIDVEDFFTRAA